jgi:hypothetical protein
MPCPSHPPWLDHSVWRGVQVMKLLVMQFPPILIQRISPCPRLLVNFRNKLIFYVEELLAQPPSCRTTPCRPVRDCLFNIFAATLHIWRPSPPSTTWGRAMPWWQGTHLTWGWQRRKITHEEKENEWAPTGHSVATGESRPTGNALQTVTCWLCGELLKVEVAPVLMHV